MVPLLSSWVVIPYHPVHTTFLFKKNPQLRSENVGSPEPADSPQVGEHLTSWNILHYHIEVSVVLWEEMNEKCYSSYSSSSVGPVFPPHRHRWLWVALYRPWAADLDALAHFCSPLFQIWGQNVPPITRCHDEIFINIYFNCQEVKMFFNRQQVKNKYK